MRNDWKNRQLTGFLVGLIVPVLASFLIYKFRYPGTGNYLEFISKLSEWDSLGKLLSLSVLPNLLFFFLAIQKEWMKGARGVLAATMLYGLVALIIFMVQ